MAIFLAMLTSSGGQVDVEGDQRLARPDHGRAGWADSFRAEIRVALGVDTHFFFQRFILAAADVLQVLALRAGGGLFIQVDRDVQLGADPLAQPAGDQHAFRHADVPDGDKWHDVCGADAGVLAGVLVQVDQLGGFGDGPKSGFFDGFGRTDEGQHGAVVIQVGVAVEQGGSRRRRGSPG